MIEEESYYLIAKIIFIFPFVLLFMFYLFIRKKQFIIKFTLFVLIGWLTLLVSTIGLNWFSISYAPTEKLMIEVANGDGSSQVFALIFGGVISIFLLLIFDALG